MKGQYHYETMATTPGEINDKIVEVDTAIVGHIFTQLSLKQGLA